MMADLVSEPGRKLDKIGVLYAHGAYGEAGF